MNVDCKVTVVKSAEDPRYVGVMVSCSRCKQFYEADGTSDRSVRRCLAMLREDCPNGERNWYADDGEARATITV